MSNRYWRDEKFRELNKKRARESYHRNKKKRNIRCKHCGILITKEATTGYCIKCCKKDLEVLYPPKIKKEKEEKIIIKPYPEKIVKRLLGNFLSSKILIYLLKHPKKKNYALGLSRELNCVYGHCGNILKKLKELDLIKRKNMNKRTKRIYLTDEGKIIAQHLLGIDNLLPVKTSKQKHLNN